MEAALDPVRLPERARPSWLVRWGVALSTSPIPPDFTNSAQLNAYLARLDRAGWTIRQAYYRNWTVWRNCGEDPRGLIVLPAERTVQGEDDFALFVAIEILRCVTGRWPVDAGAVHRLLPQTAVMPPAALFERYRAAERALSRLRFWR